jgi:hypothetical protein
MASRPSDANRPSRAQPRRNTHAHKWPNPPLPPLAPVPRLDWNRRQRRQQRPKSACLESPGSLSSPTSPKSSAFLGLLRVFAAKPGHGGPDAHETREPRSTLQARWLDFPRLPRVQWAASSVSCLPFVSWWPRFFIRGFPRIAARNKRRNRLARVRLTPAGRPVASIPSLSRRRPPRSRRVPGAMAAFSPEPLLFMAKKPYVAGVSIAQSQKNAHVLRATAREDVTA